VRDASLKTDVVGVWTDTKITVENGRAQGPQKHDWLIVIAIYFGLLFGTSILSKVTGADSLLDYFIDDQPSEDSWTYTVYLSLAVCIFLAVLSFLHWLILRRVSGWFGGSKNRGDATLVYYYLFCAGIGTSIATLAVDVIAIGMQQIAKPYGSYLYAAWLASIMIASLHIGARITETAQFVDTYAKSLGVMLVSFLIALIVIFTFGFAALVLASVFYPNIWDAIG
jgi:hypothetical protein